MDEQQAEPTWAEVKAALRAHAWRHHARCKGRGYMVRAGELVGCSCAEKRMRKQLNEENKGNGSEH